MNLIDLIKKEILEEGYKVDFIVQHSYNPYLNDAIQFFVYSNNEISHIVSTYRDPKESKRKLMDQNIKMSRVFESIKGSKLKENILFSMWLLNLPKYSFRIQEYRKVKYSFNNIRCDLDKYKKYIDLSCSWILQFQGITGINKDKLDRNGAKGEIEAYIKKVRKYKIENQGLKKLLMAIEKKINCIYSPMTKSMSHGDYFYGNWFIDCNDVFQVIDWEFSKLDEWVIIDYMSNLIAIWIEHRSRMDARDALSCFFNPVGKKEEILSDKLYEFGRIYRFSIFEIKFYFVYAYVRFYLRKERYESTPWRNYIKDMISILDSI